MSVEVRLFAALRAAAGTSRVTTDAATVAELKQELSRRYGEPFASRLERSKVVVDGEEADGPTSLAGATEVALLPPFSGGAGARREPTHPPGEG
ncbi:MAG TPA: MoaD/ThiS family protein [Nitriliruptorales bacterium]